MAQALAGGDRLPAQRPRAATAAGDDRGDQRATCSCGVPGAAGATVGDLVSRIRVRPCPRSHTTAASTRARTRRSTKAEGRLSETLAEGRYRIERTLGYGGMAVVYLAHDEELHRRVASQGARGASVGRLDASARASCRSRSWRAGSSHPNVVQVYDAGEADGSPTSSWSTCQATRSPSAESCAPDARAACAAGVRRTSARARCRARPS